MILLDTQTNIIGRYLHCLIMLRNSFKSKKKAKTKIKTKAETEADTKNMIILFKYWIIL